MCPVAADGDRTRYQRGAYGVRETSGRLCVNLGGTAGWKSCPKEGTGLFYFGFPEGDDDDASADETMAGRRLPFPQAPCSLLEIKNDRRYYYENHEK